MNANVKSGARTRQTILLKKLFQRHPEFFSELSQSAMLADGIVTSIKETATSIRNLIAECNDHYAATNGNDLFKATNKTANALASLGTPINSLEDYKELVEHLYFILWEGPGQRISTPPSSFVDVNDLRTMIQHDVDHGKGTKVAAKRKRQGNRTKN